MIRTSLIAGLCLALLAPIAARAQWPGYNQGYPGAGPAPYGYQTPPDPRQGRCTGLQEVLADISANMQTAPSLPERRHAETRWQQVREALRNECGI
jgi:hypothetical protein